MRLFVCSCLLALALLPSPATAQGRTPTADSGAVGGEVGLFLPAQDGLGAGLALEGFYEYYLTARTSIRPGLGWASTPFDAAEDVSLRRVRVALDGVYNWERGTVHPFAGAGLGIYFIEQRASGDNIGDSETKIGVTLFGGAEFFTSNTVSAKGELRYHIVKNIGNLNPDGLSLSIGLKKYF